MNIPIKFGTDGWRAIIGKEFTVNNVIRISIGASNYLKSENLPLKVVIGHDCRFNGELFADYAAKTFIYCGIEVVLAPHFVTTPAISLAAKKLNCGLGIMITASHNPPEYNGYKLKSKDGGPLLESEIKKVETNIPETIDIEEIDKIDIPENCFFDVGQLYENDLKQKINFDLINQSQIKVAFNPMYGSGQGIFKKLVHASFEYKSYRNPLFEGISPEPIPKNLIEFTEFLKANPKFDIAFLVDGDADRIGLMDGSGNYINTHEIMLILLWILVKYQKKSGEVATGFSSTDKIKLFCEKNNLPLSIVPIGFKHISHLMQSKNIIMGGEESGGISVAGHIPERDGIYNSLLILEFLAQNNLSIHQLLQEIKSDLGEFYYNRLDIKIENSQKEGIIELLKSGQITSIGDQKVIDLETLDGFKFRLSNQSWVMARLSGTEPLLRIYSEASTFKEMQNNILQLKERLVV